MVKVPKSFIPAGTRLLAGGGSMQTGLLYAVFSDGRVAAKPVLGDWLFRWKLKPHLAAAGDDAIREWFKKGFESKSWWNPSLQQPTDADFRHWTYDSVCETPDECTVEPDGVCPHGYKSWMLLAGLI